MRPSSEIEKLKRPQSHSSTVNRRHTKLMGRYGLPGRTIQYTAQVGDHVAMAGQHWGERDRNSSKAENTIVGTVFTSLAVAQYVGLMWLLVAGVLRG